jgi:hypothetical protein
VLSGDDEDAPRARAKRRASRALPFSLRMMLRVTFVLGGIGTLHAVATGVLFTKSRDGFVSEFMSARAALLAEKSNPEMEKVMEAQAQSLYDRKNVQLPLMGVNFILSLMLVRGAWRAGRRDLDGAQLLSQAAWLSIPYTAVDAIFAWVMSNDISHSFSGSERWQTLIIELSRQNWAITLARDSAEVFFYLLIIGYLGQPAVRALFTEHKAESGES